VRWRTERTSETLHARHTPTQSWGDPPQDNSGQHPAPARIEAASWGVPVCPLRSRKGIAMNLHLSITPLVSLIAGVLILVVPRLLNYIVALYLIIIGLIGLLGSGTLLR
jgi:Protein of unknown function (DUF3096)